MVQISSRMTASCSSEASELPGQQLVGVRDRGPHAARQRRKLGVRGERVQPHQAVRAAAQAGHLGREHLGVAAVPAVGQDHDDGAAPDPAAVVAVERRRARRRSGCRPRSR